MTKGKQISDFELTADTPYLILISKPCNIYSKYYTENIDGLVQNCSISNVLPMQILQSCTNHPYIVF